MRARIRAALLVALVAGVAWADVALADGPLDAALEAFKHGDYEKAAALASSVKKDDAAWPKAAYLRGESYLALERWIDAEEMFNEVLAARPDNVPALVGNGRVQMGLGTYDQAIATLEKAVKLDAKDVSARLALGEARLGKGEPEKALADIAAAVKLDPKDPPASRALVETLLKLDKPDDALDAATRLAKAIPDHPMGHFLRGLVLDRQGKDKDAIEAYEKAIAKDDRFLDAHKNLAILCTTKNMLYQDAERTKKALDHYARYFELGGRDEELRGIYESIKSFLESRKGK